MPWIKVNSEPPKQTTFEDLGYVKVVRCKDCRYRPEQETRRDLIGEYTMAIFPDDSKCPCEGEDPFLSWCPDDDWFCANGEAR